MKVPTFERFCQTFTNGVGKKEQRFIARFGDVSFEEAYPVYVAEITAVLGLKSKIDEFEKHLIEIGAPMQQSKQSESRYYQYGDKKYRFSSHVYPTGSMTSDFCVDLCADPHLINSVQF